MFIKNTKSLIRISYTFVLTIFLLHSNTSFAQDNGREFAGINFGVGISLTLDSGNNDRIGNAIVDENGIVRISQEQNKVARIMLESHYFFEPKSDDFGFLGMAEGDEWGHGPFVALQPGTDEIIEAIGLGWMVGFRKDKDSNASWNLGLGIVIDPSVNVLADGITANKLLPIGETQIRLKETSQTGLFLIASFNF